ncbi:MAG: hypothetical protein EP335_07330 [Alphaproteobacteria bacterium]|nr:MAG: hypothetical protein EP335_07330 [Alphaproteobacteria bacterium]
MDETGQIRGKLHGGRRSFYVEVVVAMMQERGLESRIEEVPLSRGLFLLERESDFALFNLIRNEDRDARFKWVGPISSFSTYFYEHVNAPTGVRSISDARKVASICVLRGNNVERHMRGLGFNNILLANSNEACAQLLGYERVSLMTESRYPWFVNDPVLSTLIVRTPVVLAITDGFIALSPNVPDEEVAAWQQALGTIRQNGLYDRLVETYLLPEGVSRAEDDEQKGLERVGPD